MIKRKIRLSALVAVSVLMLALLIGGLYGYFQDTETSTGNTFTAGTMNLTVGIAGTESESEFTETEGGDGANDQITFTAIAPGDSGSIEWTLLNMGNVDGTVTMVATVTGNENGENEPELAGGIHNVGGDGDLDDAMTVDFLANGVSQYTGSLDGLAGFLAGYAGDNVVGDSVTATVYRLQWDVDYASVGNEIQGDDAILNITFTLTQPNV